MRRLDHKLDCKQCGTIYFDVPDDAVDTSPIQCSSCGAAMGTWGEIQRDFYSQVGQGTFYLHDGKIDAWTYQDITAMRVRSALQDEQAERSLEADEED